MLAVKPTGVAWVAARVLGLLPSPELDDRVGYLVGSFPRSLETPQQVAGEVTNHRLLGLATELLERAPSRLASLDTASVRAAAELRLRPADF